MDEFRIAFFYNDGVQVTATHANLPNFADSSPTIQFSIPRLLQVPKGRTLLSRRASTPVLGAQSDTVLWCVHGQDPDLTEGDGKYGIIYVWRITKGFLLEATDKAGGRLRRTRTVPNNSGGSVSTNLYVAWGCIPRPLIPNGNLDVRPALAVNGNIVTVTCATSYYSTSPVLVSSQKAEDGSWATVLAKTPEDWWLHEIESHDSRLPRNEAVSLSQITGSSVAGTIVYTYRFVAVSSDALPVKIQMMRTSNLINLRKDDALLWYETTFEVHMNSIELAYIITSDTEGTSHKLMIFGFARDGITISCKWLHLKKDGTIDSEKNQYHPEQRYESSDGYYTAGNNQAFFMLSAGGVGNGEVPWCGPSSRQLKVYTSDRNLLLMWHTDLGWAGVVGQLEKDGTIPQQKWQWKNVKVYQGAHVKKPSDQYDLYGVLVPKGFC